MNHDEVDEGDNLTSLIGATIKCGSTAKNTRLFLHAPTARRPQVHPPETCIAHERQPLNTLELENPPENHMSGILQEPTCCLYGYKANGQPLFFSLEPFFLTVSFLPLYSTLSFSTPFLWLVCWLVG